MKKRMIQKVLIKGNPAGTNCVGCKHFRDVAGGYCQAGAAHKAPGDGKLLTECYATPTGAGLSILAYLDRDLKQITPPPGYPLPVAPDGIQSKLGVVTSPARRCIPKSFFFDTSLHVYGMIREDPEQWERDLVTEKQVSVYLGTAADYTLACMVVDALNGREIGKGEPTRARGL